MATPGGRQTVSGLKAGDGILLLNMGGPESLDEVRPFLFRLFRDPDILPLPRWLRWLAWPLAWLISTFRAPKSREAYASIGGGSPQRKTNDEVADKLALRLAADREDGAPPPVAVAMRYWHPLTDVALDRLEAAGVDRILAVPMYPQYSTTTTMSSFRELHRRLAKRRRRWAPRVVPVQDYHDDPGYVDLVAKRLRAALDGLPADPGPTAVLFSAHSIPMDRIRELDDPYPRQVEAMVAAWAANLPEGIRHDLCYQSKVGPVEWQGPPFEDKLEELAEAGIRTVVVVPVSFVSEHVETLEEIDQEYAHLAAELGIAHFTRVPTVNADEDFLDFLEGLTLAAARRPTPPACVRGYPRNRCICVPEGCG